MIRDTWLSGSDVDYKFFLGGVCKGSPDEIVVDAPDDYRMLTRKVWKVFEYALTNGYDYVFKCDADTYVHVPRLLKSGFEKLDYLGHYGGSGYWVSRRAMQALLDTHDFVWEDAEDEVVFRSLAKVGIEATEDSRFNSRTSEGPAEGNEVITVHWYSDRDYKPRERIIHCDERFGLIRRYHEGRPRRNDKRCGS